MSNPEDPLDIKSASVGYPFDNLELKVIFLSFSNTFSWLISEDLSLGRGQAGQVVESRRDWRVDGPWLFSDAGVLETRGQDERNNRARSVD